MFNENDLRKYFDEKGFYYPNELLFNFCMSLITKPFVILTGISGSGKSKIAELFAQFFNSLEVPNYTLIPVKPNWRDSKSLFGYHNTIDNSYYITPAVKLFIKALHFPSVPFFLILDEMNIARVEHYFADYLSLIESRRIENSDIANCDIPLQSIFSFQKGRSLSEAIILAAFDIGKIDEELEIAEYRNNRFSVLWNEQFFNGDPKNWTPQFRTELNQGDGRLAHRVFEGGSGKYRLKPLAEMSEVDRKKVQELKDEYLEISRYGSCIVQDNMVLHNSTRCLGANGDNCDCVSCPYSNAEKYKCSKLYNEKTDSFLVPPEIPIPLNLFTIGTVNIDETTYMFSPKILDRSNVIEFNDVDFAGLYTLNAKQLQIINSQYGTIVDDNFFFENGSELPKFKISIPNKDNVNRISQCWPEQLEVLLSIFVVLKRYNIHFGYRVMNEISMYLCNVMEYTSYSDAPVRALDNQILQKVLPKMHGAYDKIWNPLIEILGNLLINIKELKAENAEDLIEELSSMANIEFDGLRLSGTDAASIFKYPKSALKILNMLYDLATTGFAAFIK